MRKIILIALLCISLLLSLGLIFQIIDPTFKSCLIVASVAVVAALYAAYEIWRLTSLKEFREEYSKRARDEVQKHR